MKDYIIVGFGLAGLSVAEELRKRQKSFVVFDQPLQNASSIAGGVINPLILKRFTKAWRADKFIPVAQNFYHTLEENLEGKILHHTPIYRKIKSVREQNDWFTASDKPDLQAFMNSSLKQINNIAGEYDFGEVKQTGFVDTEKLLKAYRQALVTKNLFKAESFAYKKLEIHEDGVSYKGWEAQKIIFCEGNGLLQNPFFKTLPLIGNKGEYLIVKIPGLKLKVILKTAIALIPLGNDYYKFGATYSRDFKDTKPETEALKFLIEKLEEIIDCPYTIVDRQVGIRPTVLDRRPLLGQHPTHKSLYVCNGLGSHGVMIAPTAGKWLIDFIEQGKALPKKVNAQRYFGV